MVTAMLLSHFSLQINIGVLIFLISNSLFFRGLRCLCQCQNLLCLFSYLPSPMGWWQSKFKIMVMDIAYPGKGILKTCMSMLNSAILRRKPEFGMPGMKLLLKIIIASYSLLTHDKTKCLALDGPRNVVFVLKTPNASDKSQLFSLTILKQLTNAAAGTNRCAEVLGDDVFMTTCQTKAVLPKQQFFLV